MKTTMKPTYAAFASFQNYMYHPLYQQPLTGLPERTTVTRQFLSEYPLLLIVILASVGATFLTEYVTGQNIYQSISERLHSSMGIWLAAVPLAVILEEAVFRGILLLTPRRLRNVAAFLIFTLVCYGYRSVKEVAGTTAGTGLIIGWGIATYLLDSYLKRPAVFTRINQFWQRKFRQVFYVIAVLYAFSKIIDDVGMLTHWQLLLLPVLLLPGLVSGLYFGYVRMNYGFWYAVGVHILLLLTSLVLVVVHIL